VIIPGTNNDPSAAPDGEDALRRMLSEPAAFSDSLPHNVSALADRGLRRARMAGVLTLAAAAVTVGVLVATNLGSPTSAPAASTTNGVMAPTASASFTSTPSPSLTPSTSVSAPAVVIPSATTSVAPVEDWRTYSSAGGKVTFEYPAQWNAAAPKGAAGSPAVDVDVSDADGIVVASLYYGPSGGIGGACLAVPVPYTVLDSVELALPYNTAAADIITPRFAFRALQTSNGVIASYGLTSSVAGKDGKSCMFYNVVSGPAEAPLYSFADAFQVNVGGSTDGGNRKGAKSFASLEEARAYMQTPEYLSAKRMITSLKINAG
jgi:hypothetical protein